jgi:hypothetical protein
VLSSLLFASLFLIKITQVIGTTAAWETDYLYIVKHVKQAYTTPTITYVLLFMANMRNYFGQVVMFSVIILYFAAENG